MSPTTIETNLKQEITKEPTLCQRILRSIAYYSGLSVQEDRQLIHTTQYTGIISDKKEHLVIGKVPQASLDETHSDLESYLPTMITAYIINSMQGVETVDYAEEYLPDDDFQIGDKVSLEKNFYKINIFDYVTNAQGKMQYDRKQLKEIKETEIIRIMKKIE